MACALFVTVKYWPGNSNGGSAVSTQVLYFHDPHGAEKAAEALRVPGTTATLVDDVIVPGGVR